MPPPFAARHGRARVGQALPLLRMGRTRRVHPCGARMRRKLGEFGRKGRALPHSGATEPLRALGPRRNLDSLKFTSPSGGVKPPLHIKLRHYRTSMCVDGSGGASYNGWLNVEYLDDEKEFSLPSSCCAPWRQGSGRRRLQPGTPASTAASEYDACEHRANPHQSTSHPCSG